MSGDDFESLLRGAQAGDDAAWHHLVCHYSPGLHAYVRRVGAGDPDDALSEVWISAARKIASFHGGEPAFRSWLYVIAHRRAIDEGRRAARQPVPVEEVPDRVDVQAGPESQALSGAAADSLQQLLNELTAEQREVVLLRVQADLSLAQVADVMGKRVGAIKALQRRALNRLRQRIEEDGVSFS